MGKLKIFPNSNLALIFQHLLKPQDCDFNLIWGSLLVHI